ncbi:hypothetical protein PINS_up013022 [Pythium insidiosum]|nr:hypothetical protein PINS_up013022 [Pythium insidiosum]
MNLLQNDLKKVRKTVADNYLRMDFNAARYAPNADGTAMHLCAQYGFVEIAEMLLDFGLDLNARNKVGQTPLHLACKFAQIPMILWLLRQRVRLDIPDQVSCLT